MTIAHTKQNDLNRMIWCFEPSLKFQRAGGILTVEMQLEMLSMHISRKALLEILESRASMRQD